MEAYRFTGSAVVGKSPATNTMLLDTTDIALKEKKARFAPTNFPDNEAGGRYWAIHVGCFCALLEIFALREGEFLQPERMRAADAKVQNKRALVLNFIDYLFCFQKSL